MMGRIEYLPFIPTPYTVEVEKNTQYGVRVNISNTNLGSLSAILVETLFDLNLNNYDS